MAQSPVQTPPQQPAPPPAAPQPGARFRLGEILLREGLITTEQLQRGLEEQKAFGGRLGRHLIELGFMSEPALLDVLSRQLRIPLIDLDVPGTVTPNARRYARADLADQWGFCPVDFDPRRNVLIIAVSEPDPQLLSSIESQVGMHIEPRIAPSESVERAARRLFYGEQAAVAERDPVFQPARGDAERGPPSLDSAMGPSSLPFASVVPSIPIPPGAFDSQLAQQFAMQQQFQQLLLQAQQSAQAVSPAAMQEQMDRLERLEKALSTQSRVLRALVELLIEKGAFSMAEFARKQTPTK
jgi:hypothetical protein